MGRLGQPDDIARVALFLASDQSAWVTGERITVSGGQREPIGHSDWICTRPGTLRKRIARFASADSPPTLTGRKLVSHPEQYDVLIFGSGQRRQATGLASGAIRAAGCRRRAPLVGPAVPTSLPCRWPRRLRTPSITRPASECVTCRSPYKNCCDPDCQNCSVGKVPVSPSHPATVNSKRRTAWTWD